MIVQHNLPALNSYRRQGTTNKSIAKNLEKLSSGFRINRAGDDAAGLAISEKMRGQIRGLDMAEMNTQHAILLLQVAEGGLNETHAILQRMRELAVQASNGTYQDEDRAQLELEFQAVQSEVDRIADYTHYNGIKVLTTETVGSSTGPGETDRPNAPQGPDVPTVPDGPTGPGTPQVPSGPTSPTGPGPATAPTGPVTTCGDFTVYGDTSNFTYNAATRILTVVDSGVIAVEGTTTNDRILIQNGVTANVVLSGVNIDLSNVNSACALKINGTATLNLTLATGKANILKSGRLRAGLEVNIGATLTIDGTGSLNANGGTYGGAGIGSGAFTDGGDITINSGTVTATGGDLGAGIGGGGGGSAGEVTILGGAVTATGGQSSAGIGGGSTGDSGGDITISGGEVIATGGDSGAGIGGGANGDGGTVTISGGKVTATGGDNGAGIGGAEIGDGGTVTISGGEVTAIGGQFSAGIGGGDDGDGGTVEVSGGEVTATGGEWGAGIGGGTSGDGGTITISDGKVTATGGEDGAGIGGAFGGAGGNVTISGGEVTANGGECGAGIGGSHRSDGGNITISGGNVTATGGNYSAGIGGGGINITNGGGNGGTVEISGGSVTATGGICGAGIGGGVEGDGGNVTISGGTVTATGGTGAQVIGSGEGTADSGTFSTGGSGGTSVMFLGNGTDDPEINTDLIGDLSGINGWYATINGIKYPKAGGTGGTGGTQTDEEPWDATLYFQVGANKDENIIFQVKDMGCKSLGIDTISVLTRDEANAAIEAIDGAINYVSSHRAYIGSLQNRLEHTFRNLGVTGENLTFAESTIRDADMAEEMMAYTKNNILSQSAQAMLAQANQLPQGVLQLFQ